jgi:hypothetical protein
MAVKSPFEEAGTPMALFCLPQIQDSQSQTQASKDEEDIEGMEKYSL